MAKKLYKITSYYLPEEMPTQYPILLRVEKSEVKSFDKVNEIFYKDRDAAPESVANPLFCMLLQEFDRDEDGRVSVHCDEELKMGEHTYYTDGCYDGSRRFSYGDIVEVIDGEVLTLGIIIHVPRALIERHLVMMPQRWYKYKVLVYKADGTIRPMELTELQMISGRGILARSIVKALKEESHNICVQE